MAWWLFGLWDKYSLFSGAFELHWECHSSNKYVQGEGKQVSVLFAVEHDGRYRIVMMRLPVVPVSHFWWWNTCICCLTTKYLQQMCDQFWETVMFLLYYAWKFASLDKNVSKVAGNGVSGLLDFDPHWGKVWMEACPMPTSIFCAPCWNWIQFYSLIV